MSTSPPDYRLELLVIQPTPFCNIDCSYCYLPDRSSTKRITSGIVRRTFETILTSPAARAGFTVVWHAGEPLVLPPQFYREAFLTIKELNRAFIPVAQSIQTNGMLLTPEWCDLIKEYGIRIGVSVDGPAFLHDERRRTRSGKGTHAEAMRGIALLRQHGIEFHVITVLTSRSLEHPAELYDFYVNAGIRRVGFNIEEIEGAHRRSSLNSRLAETRVRRFMERFLNLAHRPEPRLEIRELAGFRRLLWQDGRYLERNQENTPFAILSVDCEGRVSTFSPELAGLKSEKYSDFMIGDIQRDDWQSLVSSAALKRMTADVEAGVARCRSTCRYFGVCGGGSPSNKFFENGSFDSTETLHCRLHTQSMTDVMLDREERAFARSS